MGGYNDGCGKFLEADDLRCFFKVSRKFEVLQRYAAVKFELGMVICQPGRNGVAKKGL